MFYFTIFLGKQIAYETLNVGNSYCVKMYGLEPLHTEVRKKSFYKLNIFSFRLILS